jgi:hypothetical protein
MFGCILCPDNLNAEAIRACYVEVGREKIFLGLVRRNKKYPYHEDLN